MRTFFPTNADAPSPQASLKRAFLLTLLLVVVMAAISFLPSADPGLPPAAASGTTSTVSADVPASQAQALAAPRSSPSLFGPGYILALVLLAGAGAGALWLRRSTGGTIKPGHLRELGRLRIGQTQHIQLVECAGEVLLLGNSANGVTLLKSFPRESFAIEPGRAVSQAVAATHYAPPQAHAPETDQTQGDHGDHAPSGLSDHAGLDHEDAPEWTVASAASINNGPDFLTVLRRYADRKTYRANTLYPPASTESAK